MAGRPKGSTNSKKEVLSQPVLSEQKFVNKNGGAIFVSVSIPFISVPKAEDEKPELRCEVLVQGIGSSKKEAFELPVKAINCLRNSFASGLYREQNQFLAETDKSGEAVHIRLSRFSTRSHGGYLGFMEFAFPIDANSRVAAHVDPLSWFDMALAMVEEELGPYTTTVIPSAETKDLPTIGDLIREKLAENNAPQNGAVLGGIFAPS